MLLNSAAARHRRSELSVVGVDKRSLSQSLRTAGISDDLLAMCPRTPPRTHPTGDRLLFIVASAVHGLVRCRAPVTIPVADRSGRDIEGAEYEDRPGKMG